MTRSPLTHRQAVLHVVFVGVVALACAALISAAALVPAPHAVLPLVVLVGIGAPMAFAAELPRAVTVLRRHRAVSTMRRHLARLPEVPHPLDG
jgi:hypothetical protein